MPDDPLLDYLQADDWPAAIRIADAHLRDPQWPARLATAAAHADANDRPEMAAGLRRHREVLETLRAEGAEAALRVATGVVDPDEHKDRATHTYVLSHALAAEPRELAALAREHPWLMSERTDAFLRTMIGRFVDDDLGRALTAEYHRLMLDAFARDGVRETVAAVDPPGDAAGRQAALRDAALRSGSLLRKLAWFYGPGLDHGTSLGLLNDIGAALLRRYRQSGGRGDLAFAIAVYRAVCEQLDEDSDARLVVLASTNLAAAMALWEQETGETVHRPTAIALFRNHLANSAPGDPLRLSSAITLAGMLVSEARDEPGTELLDEAETVLAEAIPALAGVDEEQRIIGLIHRATAALVLFGRTGQPERARDTVAEAEAAIAALPPDDPDRRRLAEGLSLLILDALTALRDTPLNEAAARLSALAGDASRPGAAAAGPLLAMIQTLFARYDTDGDPADLEAVITAARRVLDDAAPGSLTEWQARTSLGDARKLRFAVTGDIADLDAAVTQLRQVVDAQESTGEPPVLPSAYQNLSSALQERYQHTRRPADLDDAIGVTTGLLAHTAPGDPLRPGRASGLAGSLRLRHLHRGDRADLDRAVEAGREAVDALTATTPHRAIMMSTLALVLRDRFLADGGAADIDEAVGLLRTALGETTAGSPYLIPLVGNYLLTVSAGARREREQRGQDQEPLQQWIGITQRDVLERIRQTGDVAGAIAAVTAPGEVGAVTGPDDGPDLPEDDPDALTDDALPRSLFLPSVPIALPDALTMFARAAVSAAATDPGRSAELWRAVVRHPAFAELPSDVARAVAAQAALAAYLRGEDDDSLDGQDRVVAAFETLLTVSGNDPLVAFDLGRAWVTRFRRSGDETDLDRAFDVTAAAVAGLPGGSRLWRRGLRNMAGVLQQYPDGDRFSGDRLDRLDRVADLTELLGPPGDAPLWLHIRIYLVTAYARMGRHLGQRATSLARSARLVTAALDTARRTRDAGAVELLEELAGSVRRMSADTERQAGQAVEVTLAELSAETDDPELARWRLDALRTQYRGIDPATDYRDWLLVAMTLLIVLDRGDPSGTADRQDESLEVAATLERTAAGHGDTAARSGAIRRQRELYLDRVNGIRAENLDRAVACAERDLPLHPGGSAAEAMSKAHLGYALSRRLIGGRPAPGDRERSLSLSRAAVAGIAGTGTAAERAGASYLLGGVLADSLDGRLADNLEDAIEAYRAALRDQEEGGTDWANTHHQLGLMHTFRLRGAREENLAEALDHFAAELTVFTRDHYPVDWAFAMVSSGNAWSQSRGDDPRRTAAEATAAFDGALTVFTRTAFPQQWARIRASQGLLALDADQIGGRDVDATAASAHLEAALEVCTRDHDPVEWARMHEFLSIAELVLGGPDHYRKAVEHGELALSLPELTPVIRARRLSNLGSAHLELGDHQAAVTAFGEATAVFDRHGLLPETRDAAYGLLTAYARMSRWRQAAEAYEIGIAAAERRYTESLLVSSRSAEMAGSNRLVRAGVRALVHAGRATDALVALERGRARWLGESLMRDRADLDRLAAGHPGLAIEYRQAADLVRAVETAEREAAGGTRERALRTQAAEARAALAGRIEQIRRLPGYERFLDLPGLTDVARVVTAGTALTYLLPGGDEGLALVAHRDAGGDLTVHTRRLPGLTDMAVYRLLAEDGYLTADHVGIRAVLEPVLAGLGAVLAEAVGLLRELGPDRVILVPCGRLGILPVHVALLDDFPVTFAPSAWVLSGRTEPPVSPVLAGVGDPTGDLRYARTELAEIAEVFPSADPDRLLDGPAATRAALLERLPGATHLHLACHGYYDMAAPMESHLLLAGGDRLTLGELLAGNLLTGTRLAVASACQTAVSDVLRLPDEAIGLPAGFLRAGATAVLGTLWPVADLATALLMRRFYEYLLSGDPDAAEPVPMPPASALRAAQRWLAGMTQRELGAYFAGKPMVRTGEEGQPRPFAHPYYWAPFVLAGR